MEALPEHCRQECLSTPAVLLFHFRLIWSRMTLVMSDCCAVLPATFPGSRIRPNRVPARSHFSVCRTLTGFTAPLVRLERFFLLSTANSRLRLIRCAFGPIQQLFLAFPLPQFAIFFFSSFVLPFLRRFLFTLRFNVTPTCPSSSLCSTV